MGPKWLSISKLNTNERMKLMRKTNSNPNLILLKNCDYALRTSISQAFIMEARSPVRRFCCFCYSSKGLHKKKSEINRITEVEINKDYGNDDKILSDLSTFSLTEQQRRLKEALKEEKKVSREAEKVVEWVKQASAKIDVSGLGSMHSDGG